MMIGSLDPPQGDMLLCRLGFDGGDRSSELQSHDRQRDIPADELLEEPELFIGPRSTTTHKHTSKLC